jgi:hypothetical protein
MMNECNACEYLTWTYDGKKSNYCYLKSKDETCKYKKEE